MTKQTKLFITVCSTSVLLAMQALDRLQSFLDFDDAVNPHFKSENGIGRHGIAGLTVGFVFGFNVCAILASSASGLSVSLIQWFLFCSLLAIFHAGEWYVTASYRPAEVGYKSWIINHSKAYTIVMLAGSAEFWLEYTFLPWLKGWHWLIVTSAAVSIISIGIRIVGMAECGENFDHIVMSHRKEGHKLVTSGIYQYLRHPSYFGFYYWSVAAQVLMGNPIMSCVCAYASWIFFTERIPPEEETLVKIYGEEYTSWAKKTPIGIPFVKGFVMFEGSNKKIM